MNRVWTVVISVLFMGVVLSLATIPDVSVPNTFTAGTKAVATEVNANFDTIELYYNNMIDSLRARIQTDTILSNPHCDSITIDMKLYGNATADSLTISNVIISDGVATLDTVHATYGDFTTFDTVRATYGDFTLQDTLKSNVIKGDSLTYIGNDTTRFKITKAGKVGIDTTTPASKLHVAGSVRVRDTVFSTTANITTANIGTLCFGSGTEYTLVSNAITLSTSRYIHLDTQGNAALDTLTTITGGSEGDIVIIVLENLSRAVALLSGGNLWVGNVGNRVLDNPRDNIVLLNLDGSTYIELSFADNGGAP